MTQVNCINIGTFGDMQDPTYNILSLIQLYAIQIYSLIFFLYMCYEISKHIMGDQYF